MVRRSQSKLVVVFGHPAALVYKRYLQGRIYDTVWQYGKPRSRGELACAWIEYTDNAKTMIFRIALCSYHPEQFCRLKARDPTTKQYRIAFRKRLLDFAMVLLYGEADRQTFLSTGRYCWQVPTGIIIPAEILETFDPNDDAKTSALANLFRRPTLNTSPLDQFMDRNGKITEDQTLAIKKIRKENNVKTGQASRYWDGEDVKQRYGGYAVTYQLLSEGHVERVATTKRNGRPKKSKAKVSKKKKKKKKKKKEEHM